MRHSVHKPMTSVVWMAVLAVLLAFSTGRVLAQAVLQLKIGTLQSWYFEPGCEPEEAFLKIQQTGLEWPALYANQDHQAAKALWIGTTNFTDHPQYGGLTYENKVVHCGPRVWDTQRETIPIAFKLYGRYDHPSVLVDGLSQVTELINTEALDGVDADLIADRVIHNVVNTSIGVTMTRRIYAWGQKEHDTYFIYDYVFKNTGNIDADPEIEMPGKTLTDVWFFYQYRYVGAREGTDWAINSARWGINQTLKNLGEFKASDSEGPYLYPGDYEDYLNGVAGADSMRCTYAWMGRHSGLQYDVIGSPDITHKTGRLGTPGFVGSITLHADKSASDKTDNPRQPATTTWQQSDDPPTRANSAFDREQMRLEWQWITRGHRKPRHYEQVGSGYPDKLEGTPGGFSNCIGYGPYTLAPGDSIHIVMAEGVNGLSRKMCEDIGKLWYDEYSGKVSSATYNLPDGSTTTNKDEFKNAWVMTGEDSLLKVFSKARQNFSSGYSLVTPPPPPDLFEVNSGGDRIFLSWSNSAESATNFGGYRVYRAIAKPDTTYEMIFECGEGTANPVVNNFEDTTPIRQVSYYYYVVSVDDSPQKQESSLFWTQTIEPARLKRQAGASLEDIRVVPNPFIARNKELQYPGEPDKIAFLDIPGQCTIRIYTERGDLIKTIEHTDGSGDHAWNSNTDYGQVVVSGIYIAVFETPDGQRAIRKFVVIR
ncbi:MAG TPA: hypothetical protein PKN04_03390 [bacterium]|nr:hypothetical protein [bacterium]HNT64799.1 hypothetical protein [bacterium]